MKRKFLYIVCIIVLIYSSGKIIKRQIDIKNYNDNIKKIENIKDESAQKNMKSEDNQTEEENDQENQEESVEYLTDLKKEIPELVGWIRIKDSKIDFPVVQNADNYFYLDHDYKKNYHPFGAIYLDSENNGFFDKNSVIYGHNIRKRGAFFNELLNYKDDNFYKKHKYIEIDTFEGRNSYEIFFAYDVRPNFSYTKKDFTNDEFLSYINEHKNENYIKSDLNFYDKDILTLQTCDDSENRFVIHAAKIN